MIRIRATINLTSFNFPVTKSQYTTASVENSFRRVHYPKEVTPSISNSPRLNARIWNAAGKSEVAEAKPEPSRPPEEDIFEEREPTYLEKGLSLLRHGKAAQKQVSLKHGEFAPAYIAKVRAKLGSEFNSSVDPSPPLRTKKMAAQAILQATAACCDFLGPAVAISLARETAKELIPKGSIQENKIESKILPGETIRVRDNLLIAEVRKPTPAAASTQNVVLQPWFVSTASKEAGLAAVGHEGSHLKHRDIVANFGDATLKSALSMAGNMSFNPATWELADKTLVDIKLASAEASREREYRCDDEAVSNMLEVGLSKETILKGFSEIFYSDETEVGILADHPPTKLRLDAVKRKLDQQQPT